MTQQPTNLQRLRRLELRMKQMQDELDMMRPLAQWALAEIMSEQESRLELNQRLGIK